jgi:hypothetical protein
MNGNEHKACYGDMFPDTASDKPQRDKVFSYTLLPAGGFYRRAPRAEVNQAAWSECTRCPEFEHCYKLSMAKLALETAIGSK